MIRFKMFTDYRVAREAISIGLFLKNLGCDCLTKFVNNFDNNAIFGSLLLSVL